MSIALQRPLRNGFLIFMLGLSWLGLGAVEPVIVPLWPGLPPGAKAVPNYQESTRRPGDLASTLIFKVSQPTLEIFQPDPLPANGVLSPAIVVCPGGGYACLAYEHEGRTTARWLAAHGFTAAILKYRLPSDEIMEDKGVGPLQDVQEAIRTLRRQAARWHIDPERIGIMGFSAGGHLAASAATRHAERVYPPVDAISARPDFCVLMYPVISMQLGLTHPGSRQGLLGDAPSQALVDNASCELRADKTTPPTFLVHSQNDDLVPVENSLGFFRKLTACGVPAELHIYPRGGHGYGLGVRGDSPKSVRNELERWLKEQTQR
ncbi:MAG TPA: alpha/beta hydrolase [Holophaga sp.]|jgi:acetyl esterase/lipase|nr:alpha/beta hydrolase [Holophaga sp.]